MSLEPRVYKILHESREVFMAESAMFEPGPALCWHEVADGGTWMLHAVSAWTLPLYRPDS